MSRPDFNLFTAPTRATAATAATQSNMTAARPALPAAFSGGASASGGFSSTFRAVQADVASYLANGSETGSSASSAAGSGLNVDGAALRARLNAARAIGGTEGVDDASQQAFLESIRPYAEETGQRLGVSPDLVAAHAALESGWGQRPLRGVNGGDSNNLFGIKASGGWQGDVAAATTTEYEFGAAVKKVERFRSYPDQATAFRDYADMLSDNPRYQHALNTGSDARAFARGLAQGGYATDPSYADKLSAVAARIARRP